VIGRKPQHKHRSILFRRLLTETKAYLAALVLRIWFVATYIFKSIRFFEKLFKSNRNLSLFLLHLNSFPKNNGYFWKVSCSSRDVKSNCLKSKLKCMNVNEFSMGKQKGKRRCYPSQWLCTGFCCITSIDTLSQIPQACLRIHGWKVKIA